MHTLAEVLTELTELEVIPEVPELTDADWRGMVAAWMTTEPETEEPEEETVTEPAEDYSYRSRGC